MRTEWVDCPLCEGTDMRCDIDEEGYTLVHCVNHMCPSNVLKDTPEPQSNGHKLAIQSVLLFLAGMLATWLMIG